MNSSTKGVKFSSLPELKNKKYGNANNERNVNKRLNMYMNPNINGRTYSKPTTGSTSKINVDHQNQNHHFSLKNDDIFNVTKNSFFKNSSVAKTASIHKEKDGFIEAELINVKIKLNEANQLAKKLGVENLKLMEENKKISNLMEKVIESYSAHAHEKLIDSYDNNKNLESLEVRLTEESKAIEYNDENLRENQNNQHIIHENKQNIENIGTSRDHHQNNQSKNCFILVSNRINDHLKTERKNKVQHYSLDINSIAEKHIKELKDCYIFKKLKDTIKILKYDLEERENELKKLKESQKATSIQKVEREYKIKIDECKYYKVQFTRCKYTIKE